MGRLAAWSGRKILALWAAWFGLLSGLFVLHVRQVRRQLQSEASPVVPAESGPRSAELGQRPSGLPEQHTDLVYSVVFDTKALLKEILVLVGPPGIATALWVYARRRRDPEPPA